MGGRAPRGDWGHGEWRVLVCGWVGVRLEAGHVSCLAHTSSADGGSVCLCGDASTQRLLPVTQHTSQVRAMQSVYPVCAH